MRSERIGLDVAAVSRYHETSRTRRGRCCASCVRRWTRPYTSPCSTAARSCTSTISKAHRRSACI